MNNNYLLLVVLVSTLGACAKQKGSTAAPSAGAETKAVALESKMQGEFKATTKASTRSSLSCERAGPPKSFDRRLRPGSTVVLVESDVDEKGILFHTKAEHKVLAASADRLSIQKQIIESENGPAGFSPGTQIQATCQFDRKSQRPNVVCHHTPELPPVTGDVPEYCWIDENSQASLEVEYVKGTFRLADGETVQAEMETIHVNGTRICASAKIPKGEARGTGEETIIVLRSKEVPTPFLEDCDGAAVLYKFEEQRNSEGQAIKASRLELLDATLNTGRK